MLVLPSDHFIGEEDRLMDRARMACLAVKRDPSRLILLGVKPDRDEPEYGYLLPNKKHLPIVPDMSEISRFIEKPDPKTARRLTRAGGLWNTMIMVFKTKTMLHWVSRLAPSLYQQFQQVYEAIGMPGESDVLRKIYQGLKPMNFSKEFLEPMAKHYPSTSTCSPGSRSLVERLGYRKPNHGCAGKNRQSSSPYGNPKIYGQESRKRVSFSWKAAF